MKRTPSMKFVHPVVFLLGLAIWVLIFLSACAGERRLGDICKRMLYAARTSTDSTLVFKDNWRCAPEEKGK